MVETVISNATEASANTEHLEQEIQRLNAEINAEKNQFAENVKTYRAAGKQLIEKRNKFFTRNKKFLEKD